ncbi:hypothetical protein GCM10011403_16200 [Pseudohongiella nitratireducens]|jgi:hypothetical protein|uniref:S-layer protein n=1 Tax=Pseudohongiella nitratireducens TaxID=1768907 RepID=A0A917GXK1_9GAMM|nr:hypothetical protein [Pseudohongiella nitratireducens]GGG59635.1 hypothetical protein GCM10011403_16200 [Pseudohongiella nitratireducens]
MAISIEAREDLVTLVVGMFDAAPGAAVLTDLTVAYEAGIAGGASSADVMANIATSLASSDFYKSIYPEFLTNSEFVTKLVGNLAGDTLDGTTKADASALLLAQLNGMDTSTAASKAAARAAVTMTAIAAIESAAADDETFGDLKTQFTNKVEVATFYSVDQQQNISDLADAQDVIKNVDETDASVDTAKSDITGETNSGETYSLTGGVDSLTGTNFNDTFTALSVQGSTSTATTTFSSFDAIDGGDGEDTLNIYTTGADNKSFPANATVKNVEIINVHNNAAAAALADASKFTGVEQLWQIGNNAANVTNLTAATTAGFKNSAAGTAFSVTPTTSAATATVAFDGASNVGDTSSLTVGAAGGASTALAEVSISGTLATGSADLDTTINTGSKQTTLTLNAGTDVDLTIGTAATVNLDASGSTASIEYTGGNSTRSIKSGSGADVIGTTTATSATVASTVETGAGKDSITINNTGSGTTTVEAGEGNDTVTVTAVGSGKTTINAGAGDDTVSVAGGVDSIKTTDAYDGGEGTDVLSVAGKTFDAEDYIILTDVVTGFESLKVTGGTAAVVNASKLTGYTTFDVATTTSSTLTKVAASQSVTVSDGGATVSASGYVAPSKGVNVGTLAGTLNVTSTDSGNTITANAETVNLTVAPASSNNDGKTDTLTTTLTGDAKTANVTLTAKTDNAGTATVTTDDVYEASNVAITTSNAAGGMDGLTSVTLSGNGTATITNAASTALATVDASGLASVTTAGAASAGLTYDTANGSVAETVTLGSALDDITVENSTQLTTDTINGLSLVAQAGSTTKVDTAKSDDLTVENAGVAITTFAKTTTTQTSLNLALVDLAAAAADNVVFQLGGDTYVYSDVNTDNILNDSDIVVKLSGTVDLDLLIDALNT